MILKVSEKKKSERGKRLLSIGGYHKKDSMALLKLHRISKNLPADALTSFGRWQGRQVLSIIPKVC